MADGGSRKKSQSNKRKKQAAATMVDAKEEPPLAWFFEGDDENGAKPSIPEVPAKAMDKHKIKAKSYFYPNLMSLGPYHYGAFGLQSMESCKRVAGRRFTKSIKSSDKINAYQFYYAVGGVEKQAMESYDCKALSQESIKNFTRIMFIDGCFLLYLMLQLAEQDEDDCWREIVKDMNEGNWDSNFASLPLLFGDMMLLENQLPYVVLHTLLRKKIEVIKARCGSDGSSEHCVPVDSPTTTHQKKFLLRIVDRFLEQYIMKIPQEQIHKIRYRDEDMEPTHILDHLRIKLCANTSPPTSNIEPTHILDHLRIMLCANNPPPTSNMEPTHILDHLRIKLCANISPPTSNIHDPIPPIPPTSNIHDPIPPTSNTDWSFLHSAAELKAAGISFSCSKSRSVLDVKFSKFLFCGKLHLPPILVDDSTKNLFLNLIAYEMSGTVETSHEIVSYVWLMRSLFCYAKDVPVLESKGILINSIGNDRAVVDLFKELDVITAPNPRAYEEVRREIQQHRKSRWKRLCWGTVENLKKKHLGNPLAVISLLLASYLLFLTSVQTYFTVYPRK